MRRNCLIAVAIIAAIYSGTASAQEKATLPPTDALKLSAIVAKIELRADFRYVERIDWDTAGYYDIIYFTTDKAKVEIKIDPVSGEPQ